MVEPASEEEVTAAKANVAVAQEVAAGAALAADTARARVSELGPAGRRKALRAGLLRLAYGRVRGSREDASRALVAILERAAERYVHLRLPAHLHLL